MNKTVLTVCMTIGTTIGSFIPVWFGDSSFFDGWSILGGLIGGIAGIWLGVKISKQIS